MDYMDVPAVGAPHYLITGGTPLYGEAIISGAKNAVTKMMIASLLTKETCTLKNVPLLGDMFLTSQLCQGIGASVELSDHTLSICTEQITRTEVLSEVGKLNRIAVMLIGPLLHRCGEVTIPAPGGDRIGPRPIDFHLAGLRQMGAVIEERGGAILLFHQ